MVLSERNICQIMVKSTLTSVEVEKICLDIDSEIAIVSKNLAQLNIKKATRQSFKPHEFKSNRKRLAQLLGCANYVKQIS
jgi:ribosomal protein L29